MTTHHSPPRITRRIAGPALVIGAFALSSLTNLAFHVAEILFTDNDPHRSEGPIESIISISVVAGVVLVIALAVGHVLARDPGRSRTGAVVFGALSIISLVVFWSGAPAIFGATAAWLAGFTKDRSPLGGAARAFGIVGLGVALLDIVAVLAGSIDHALTNF